MSRHFISGFMLPLVRGGTLEVGRPLSRRGVELLARAHALRPTAADQDAAGALARARRHTLTALVPAPPTCEIDDVTWRLGGAVHDLLTLAHPRIAGGPGAESRVARIAAAATALADLGPPPSANEALARHALVARLPEVIRFDRTVRYWLGRQTFVGHRPPTRILALPRVRGVKVETVRRAWLRDVGVPAVARPAFLALTVASPLGEALFPLGLDPPPSWGRLLSVLKFPVICRLVAARMVDIGVGRAGDALAEPLYRFASLQDTAGSVPPSPQAVAFALGFLAHVAWLGHLFGQAPGRGTPQAIASAAAVEGAGRELAVVLAAAADVQPRLIWPADVPRTSDLGQGFTAALGRMFDRHEVRKSPRWPAARELALQATAIGTASASGSS